MALYLDGKGSSGEQCSIFCLLEKSVIEVSAHIIRDRNGTSDKCNLGKEIL